MYVARILTNETCNQNCAFCTARRASERREVAAPNAIAQRMDEAVRDGAREIVLTGGEPTLRRDLPFFVGYARRAGASTVTLETNAALIDAPRALALARAGLTKARVHLPAWGETCDAITQDEGGFVRTLAGIAALGNAGIALEIATPVVRANALALAELPERLASLETPIEALFLGVPTLAPEGHDDELLALGEAARVIAEVVESARKIGLVVQMEPGAMVPPCVFPRPPRVAHLFSLTRGGGSRADHTHVPACADCAVRDRCPGVPRAALARDAALAHTIKPIEDERTRRRLSLVSNTRDQIARELVTRDVRRNARGEVVRENIVRVNFHCNQACRFCFVSTHLPPAEEAAIEAAIREIAEERGILTLSGGEPTLNARLAEYVALGKRLGVREVELQTNATRLADRTLTRTLVDAGVDTFFVSLHAPVAEVSDAITEAPGTFAKSVLGIDAIAETGRELRLNFVFCEQNRTLFPDHVRLVSSRWPNAELTISFVASSTDVVPRDKALMPRYSDVLPFLGEGIRLARELGVRLTGYESMCGVPLCQVPDDISSYFSLAEIPEGYDRGEFIKAEACSSCALERRCFGIRRGYAELHGTSELVPITSG